MEFDEAMWERKCALLMNEIERLKRGMDLWNKSSLDKDLVIAEKDRELSSLNAIMKIREEQIKNLKAEIAEGMG